ncbi:MAG: GAF domain-containing protein [Candidatus Aminicenantes bacterium]|nr:MAG: GAF domain-containing protein [Candidatus Aminicenantes bacterium]
MKAQHKILFLSIILGVIVWIIDAGLHAVVFSQGAFLEKLITNVSTSEIIFRLILLIFFITFGVILSGMMVKRQRVEEELKGVNRALKVISESNKALVHAEDEIALLRDICRIIVEIGGYRLAWVGFAEQDSKKSVRPVAQFGEPADYIKTLEVTWADTRPAQCPSGTAIRTGKSIAVRDILSVPDFITWRKNALKFGYRSSIALPLTFYERTYGALTIYAAEPDAFSQEEIKLLLGLAADLAYGIDAIRTRAYHKIAEEFIQEYYTSLAFLSQTIIDLVELSPKDNIYQYIGHQLYKLIKGAVVIINCYHQSSNTLEICEIVGISPYLKKVKKILGRNPVGMKFPMTPLIKKTISDPKVVRVQQLGNLVDTGSIGIPQPIVQQLIELLEIGEIFSLGFQKGKMLFGHALVLVKKGNELKNTEVIKTFIHQASIILHRRYIEQELKESENKFRLLAEITPGIIFIHRGKEIIYANHATKIITGYSMRELKNMNFWGIVSPEYREQQKQVGLELLKGTDRQNPSEITLEKKNQDKCWVQMISKAFDFEGSAAVMVTAVDITQVKKAQEMEKRHQQQLMQADKMISLGNLVAGVAHEINNPTNAIIVNTPVLMDIWKKLKPLVDQYYEESGNFEVGGIPYSEISESVSDLFSGITASAKRIKTLVEDLKDFARPNLVEMTRGLDINQVVKQSIALLHNMIVKATGNFSVEYGDDIPFITGNPQQLEQVFINLIQNACQALETNQQAIHVFTAYDTSVKRVLIGVKDEGPGIPAENLKFIQDPFFTTKRSSGGTGLGLSVSARIIKEHNGELEVESIVGKGSTFTVLLPPQEIEAGDSGR